MNADRISGCGYQSPQRECPLFALSHDARFTGFGCVDDLAKPCLVARGKSFTAMFNAAHAELFRRLRAHYLKDAIDTARSKA